MGEHDGPQRTATTKARTLETRAENIQEEVDGEASRGNLPMKGRDLH